MAGDSGLVGYYSARASEYEKVYAKPERQADLRKLHGIVRSFFAHRRVLDVACGTGYWTRTLATDATSVTGCDLSESVLALARRLQPATAPASFVLGDAFALESIPGDFDAAFVGFWWSHVKRADVARFLHGLHRRLPAQSRVMILDNRYVAGSNWPITRTDEEGNTYQRRTLDSGAEHEVLKNFPSAPEVGVAITDAGVTGVRVHEMEYYWYAVYEIGRA
jgi:demethylmenaquinone methyltransferase/2-methoxy-6-polyprenyl-1,4-benzoquinol methylase